MNGSWSNTLRVKLDSQGRRAAGNGEGNRECGNVNEDPHFRHGYYLTLTVRSKGVTRKTSGRSGKGSGGKPPTDTMKRRWSGVKRPLIYNLQQPQGSPPTLRAYLVRR